MAGNVQNALEGVRQISVHREHNAGNSDENNAAEIREDEPCGRHPRALVDKSDDEPDDAEGSDVCRGVTQGNAEFLHDEGIPIHSLRRVIVDGIALDGVVIRVVAGNRHSALPHLGVEELVLRLFLTAVVKYGTLARRHKEIHASDEIILEGFREFIVVILL